MLILTVPAAEYYDWNNNEFIYTKEQTLKLEHSLVSLSKWEAKWRKSFLSTENKTPAETLRSTARLRRGSRRVLALIFLLLSEKGRSPDGLRPLFTYA